MVSHHAPRVYATVTAHVNTDFSIRMVKSPAGATRGLALIMHNNNPGVCCCCCLPPADTEASSYWMTAIREEEEAAGEEGEEGS